MCGIPDIPEAFIVLANLYGAGEVPIAMTRRVIEKRKGRVGNGAEGRLLFGCRFFDPFEISRNSKLLQNNSGDFQTKISFFSLKTQDFSGNISGKTM